MNTVLTKTTTQQAFNNEVQGVQVTYLFHFLNVWILLKTGGNIK
jgi:hypothetical protein